MFKFLLINLIIKTHAWDWKEYPSPRRTTYWYCGVSKPAYVCDPDGMLTDQERIEIVELVEEFKEKTKRPKSKFICTREGVRLIVALAKQRIRPESAFSEKTHLCNATSWTSSCTHGIELNTNGFRYCYWMGSLVELDKDEYERINNADGSCRPCSKWHFLDASFINYFQILLKIHSLLIYECF
uniref:Uncharacterized protein n=1 Tax=Meloidogyne incognita TaxID=6306 RepID=A0A914MKT8_MELIC